MFPWDQGAALGIVRANGTPLGDNTLLGGTNCPSCKIAGDKFVMAYGSDQKMPAFGNITSPSTGAWLETVFILKHDDRFCGHVFISGWINEGPSTVNEWLDVCVATAGRTDQDAQA